MRYRCSPDPADAIQWFKKDQVGVWNWERWSSPEFEDLWNKGLAETDTTKRNAIYLRMQEIMENTGAYVWITFDPLVLCHASTRSIPPSIPAARCGSSCSRRPERSLVRASALRASRQMEGRHREAAGSSSGEAACHLHPGEAAGRSREMADLSSRCRSGMLGYRCSDRLPS